MTISKGFHRPSTLFLFLGGFLIISAWSIKDTNTACPSPDPTNDLSGITFQLSCRGQTRKKCCKSCTSTPYFSACCDNNSACDTTNNACECPSLPTTGLQCFYPNSARDCPVVVVPALSGAILKQCIKDRTSVLCCVKCPDGYTAQ